MSFCIITNNFYYMLDISYLKPKRSVFVGNTENPSENQSSNPKNDEKVHTGPFTPSFPEIKSQAGVPNTIISNVPLLSCVDFIQKRINEGQKLPTKTAFYDKELEFEKVKEKILEARMRQVSLHQEKTEFRDRADKKICELENEHLDALNNSKYLSKIRNETRELMNMAQIDLIFAKNFSGFEIVESSDNPLRVVLIAKENGKFIKFELVDKGESLDYDFLDSSIPVQNLPLEFTSSINFSKKEFKSFYTSLYNIIY